MSAKTIFIIIITILVTIVLMKNTDEVRFWIFGDTDIPKLAVLGTMFGLGLIVGYMLGRPRKKIILNEYPEENGDLDETNPPFKKPLTDEDRDYIN